MHNPNETSGYIEDEFDLEDLKNKACGLKRKNILQRKIKKKSQLLFAISSICFLIAAFSAGWVARYFSEAKIATLINEKASGVLNDRPPHQGVGNNEKTAAPTSVVDVEEAAPIMEDDQAILGKIADLREAFSNDDIVGYLQIDNTNIDYAVAQAADNEFYLNRDLYGNQNTSGSIYMDYECDAHHLSRNTVIYGHNMRDGSMFHNLRYFVDPDYYAARRFIRFTTPYDETVWEVFSFYETDTDFYYIQVVFPDDDSFLSLVSEMKERSLYDTGIEVGLGDKILTLSTCTNTASDARFVLNARLVRE